MAMKISNTIQTRRPYDRLAFFYDFLEAPMERFRFSAWRVRVRERIGGQRVLFIPNAAMEPGIRVFRRPLLA